MEVLKILIPTDFSKEAQFAIDYAKNFKATFEVEIILVNVVEVSDLVSVNTKNEYNDMMGVSIEDVNIKKDNALRQMNASVKKELNNFNVITTKISVGPLVETICSAARSFKSDMILMGTKGVHNFTEWLSGTDSQMVARHSEIPVLTLMCDRSDWKIENILFISDFTDVELPPDPLIKKMSEGLNAQLHCLSIVKNNSKVEQVKNNVSEFANNQGLADCKIHVHVDSNVVEGIQQFDLMDEMDMIFIGTHGRKGIRHLLKSSIAENLINHLYKPVLVYKI